MLVGNFGPIARVGVHDVVAEQGMVPIGEHGVDVFAQVAELHPDAVVLDMDSEDSSATAAALAGRYPGVTVIACSADRPHMRVVPSWGRDAYSAILTGAALAQAVRERM